MLSLQVNQLAEQRHASLPMLRPDVVDVEAMQQLRTEECNLSDCRGACCAGGAGLTADEVPLLRAIRHDHERELLDLGLCHRPEIIDGPNARTSLRTDADGRGACSWLLADGRCSLQALAMRHGVHQWTYKPLACILYPLRVRSKGGLRVLTCDKRSLASNAETPPCGMVRPDTNPLAGLTTEVRFIYEIWDHDLEAAIQLKPLLPSDQTGTIPVGLVATTAKHAVWAFTSQHGSFAAKVTLRGDDACCRRERRMLEYVGGGYFPRLVEGGDSAVDGRTVLCTELMKGTLGLRRWMATRPAAEEIEAVAQELLRACVALEDAGVFHCDICPRNILIQPRRGKAFITDFELVVYDGRRERCHGGTFGYAAPEQYVNTLGLHSHSTESFFVGTVLFHAFHNGGGADHAAYPFCIASAETMPAKLLNAMWSLIGDPRSGYAVNTRESARRVLSDWGSAPQFQVPRYEESAPKDSILQRTITGPGGITVSIQRTGIAIQDRGRTLYAWNGLVDVAKSPETWNCAELDLGGVLIGVEGIRLRADLQDSCQSESTHCRTF